MERGQHLLRGTPGRTAWMRDAACRGRDVTLFYPERGEDTAAAKAICATCPVVADCLRWAFAVNDRDGVLGGLAPDERAALRRKPRSNAPCGTVARYKAHLRDGVVPDPECRRAAAQDRAERRDKAGAA